MMHAPADVLLRLAMVPGLGPITAHRLLSMVEDPAEIFHLGMQRLRQIDGIGAERARRIADPHGDDIARDERAHCSREGIRIITLADAEYPRFLNKLTDPPLAIWVQGKLQKRDELSLAVVGPRRPSPYGHRQAHRLSRALADYGTTIVSGMARGIDTVAHEAALAAKGRTIGVLGSGFGQFYPKENRALADKVIDGHGAVISEYPCQTKPSPGTFPRRNRIVAALSLATLVIEAGQRSGALITARLAGELGQEALVLPGPIDKPEHQGSNKLIRDGATLVMGIEDILEEVPPLATLASVDPQVAAGEADERQGPSLNDRERQIYLLLDDAPRSVDDLQRVASLPASSINATLISLELRRLAKRAEGGYVRAL